jgi:hypothetical protein
VGEKAVEAATGKRMSWFNKKNTIQAAEVKSTHMF